MRNLVRKTNKIFQKIALEHVKNSPFSRKINEDAIHKYLGLPRYRDARLFEKIPPPGVMIGLAYNAFGGSIMYIEASSSSLKPAENVELEDKKGKDTQKGVLIVTGNIHDVMKESCQLAYSYARYIASTFFNNHYLEKNEIHLNFPEIEIGKDGPSAGVAITSTLLSLALDKRMEK